MTPLMDDLFAAVIDTHKQLRALTAAHAPQLEGDTNYLAWRDRMQGCLEYSQLLQFAHADVRPPDDEVEFVVWTHQRATCYKALFDTTLGVHERLQVGGYVPDGNPHSLWKALENTIGTVQAPRAGALLKEITTLDRASFSRTSDLLDKFLSLRQGLETFIEFDNTMLALCLLGSIKDTHGDLYEKHMSAGSRPSFAAVQGDPNVRVVGEDYELRGQGFL